MHGLLAIWQPMGEVISFKSADCAYACQCPYRSSDRSIDTGFHPTPNRSAETFIIATLIDSVVCYDSLPNVPPTVHVRSEYRATITHRLFLPPHAPILAKVQLLSGCYQWYYWTIDRTLYPHGCNLKLKLCATLGADGTHNYLFWVVDTLIKIFQIGKIDHKKPCNDLRCDC